MITWKCHICREERPDHAISVLSKDISEKHGMPTGTMSQNVRYCNDNMECAEKAASYSLTK